MTVIINKLTIRITSQLVLFPWHQGSFQASKPTTKCMTRCCAPVRPQGSTNEPFLSSTKSLRPGPGDAALLLHCELRLFLLLLLGDAACGCWMGSSNNDGAMFNITPNNKSCLVTPGQDPDGVN